MTDQEIKDLAHKYVKEVYNGDTDFIDEAVSIIGWLWLDHCIVSRELVQKHHKDYAFLARKHPKASERRIAENLLEEIEDLFGTSMFNQNQSEDEEIQNR